MDLHLLARKPMGDIGVHPGARELFADLIHHQHVQIARGRRRIQRPQRQAGHVAHRLLQIGRFGLQHPVAVKRHDLRQPVIGILNRADAEKHLATLQLHPRHLGHEDADVIDAPRMAGFGPRLLAQPDRKHLGQPAFVRRAERSMRLDPVEQDNPIGGIGMAVHPHRHAVVEHADLIGLHRRADFATEALFGHAQFRQQRGLPLCGGAAVAAHGGHDKGMRPARADLGHDGGQQFRQLRQPAAACGDGDGHARLDLARAIGLHRLCHGGARVVDLGCGKGLTAKRHARQRRILDQFHIVRFHLRCPLRHLLPRDPNRPRREFFLAHAERFGFALLARGDGKDALEDPLAQFL